MKNLGLVALNLGNLNEAKIYFDGALAILREHYGDDPRHNEMATLFQLQTHLATKLERSAEIRHRQQDGVLDGVNTMQDSHDQVSRWEDQF